MARIFKAVRAAWLAGRTKFRQKKAVARAFKKFGIVSQAPFSSYRRFMASFPDIKLGGYKASFSHASGESLVMLALARWVKRKTINVLGIRVPSSKVRAPSNVFKMRFVLTSQIEPELRHPISPEKPASVCVVTGIQGPGKKFVARKKLVEELNAELGEPWQNFLLREMVSHSRKQGLEALALLRPEYNPGLTDSYLAKHGVSPKEAKQMRSQFYAAARKNKLKKVKGSKYFWILF